jgi:8-oxo-dGTP pyrophosphatase MutT (NUDIX family)
MIKKTLFELVYYALFPLIWLWLKTSKRVYVVLCFNGNLVLTQNWLGDHKYWRLPGGGIKKGESPKQAASRELKEELGIAIKTQEFTEIELKNRNFKFFKVFLDESPEIKVNNNEIFAVCYANISKINRLKIEKSSAQAIACSL